MNTNMKDNNKNELSTSEMNELNLSEMEKVSGGILPLALAFGTIALGGVLLYVFKK